MQLVVGELSGDLVVPVAVAVPHGQVPLGRHQVLVVLSSPFLTSACKCRGMFPGLLRTTGLTFGSTYNLRGGELLTRGSFWCVHTLKADAL